MGPKGTYLQLFLIHVHIPLSQPPSAQPLSPSPSAQTSASSHPLSSAAPPGTPDAWPRKSAANCAQTHTHTQRKVSRLLSVSFVWMQAFGVRWQLTWQACTLGRCLWIPFPPVCSVCTIHSGECVSAPSGPPCLHRSTSPSASQSRSDSRSPLTHTSADIAQVMGYPSR